MALRGFPRGFFEWGVEGAGSYWALCGPHKPSREGKTSTAWT